MVCPWFWKVAFNPKVSQWTNETLEVNSVWLLFVKTGLVRRDDLCGVGG